MSEQPDNESKTELPTEKRREEALDRGNTPISRELINLGFMLASMALVVGVVSGVSGGISEVLYAFLDRPAEFKLETAADVAQLLHAMILGIVPLLAPLPLALLFVGVGLHVVQTPPRISRKRIEPDLSRVSLRQGWKRIASLRGFVELLKGLLKLFILLAVGVWFLVTPDAALIHSIDTSPEAFSDLLLAASFAVIWPATAAVAFMAAVDIVFSRFIWEKNLQMTRQEVRDEMKQSEGDPVFASRRRAIARRRINQMMIQAVPRATLVVANPTHFAVALRYVRSEGGAPVVVAKGQDLIALQIRRIADSEGIPVVEDRALARSLYKAVEVNQAISPEFYSAIANIILMLRNAGNRRIIQAMGQ